MACNEWANKSNCIMMKLSKRKIKRKEKRGKIKRKLSKRNINGNKKKSCKRAGECKILIRRSVR